MGTRSVGGLLKSSIRCRAAQRWAHLHPKVRVALCLVAVAVVALVVVSVWWLVQKEEPRARVYGEATACMLTPSAGLSAPGAGEVWQLMQDVSLRTRAKVQFLEVNGPQTAENARSYLTSLIQNKCAVIVSVGAAPLEAGAIAAPAYPQVRFLLVGASAGDQSSNVTVVPDSSPQSHQQIENVLSAAVEGD